MFCLRWMNALLKLWPRGKVSIVTPPGPKDFYCCKPIPLFYVNCEIVCSGGWFGHPRLSKENKRPRGLNAQLASLPDKTNIALSMMAKWLFVKVPYIFKIYQIVSKIACISTDYHTFRNVWLKLHKLCGRSSLLKILTSEILQNAPNDTKFKPKNQTVAYICSPSPIWAGVNMSKFHKIFF